MRIGDKIKIELLVWAIFFGYIAVIAVITLPIGLFVRWMMGK